MTPDTAGRKSTTTTKAATARTTTSGFSADERAAMKERAKELRAEAKGEKDRAKGLADLASRITDMPDGDRALAEAVHRIVTQHAPDLLPKTWYGMPAYADADGKVVCFFKAASKFDVRYCELGFNEEAALDDGTMWPTVFALTAMDPANEKRIAALVTKAVG